MRESALGITDHYHPPAGCAILGGGMDLDLKKTVDLLRLLLREQGRLLLQRWPSVGELTYNNRRDFTTRADVEIEQNLKQALLARFPSHAVCGEETEAENLESDFRWLIDPIDGTKYFAAQSSLFSISVGLTWRERPVLGAVYGAASGQCFYAWQGGGSYLDGRRLRGSAIDEMRCAIVNVDTPEAHRLPDPERLWFEEKLVELTRRVFRVRALGIGSLACCWLASGALDAYIDLTGRGKAQDLAAGRVIMQEASMRVEEISPPHGPPRLLAAPAPLWERLFELLG